MKVIAGGVDVTDKLKFEPFKMSAEPAELGFKIKGGDLTVANGDTITFTWTETGTSRTKATLIGHVTGAFSGPVTIFPCHPHDMDWDQFFIDDFVRGMREGRIEV